MEKATQNTSRKRKPSMEIDSYTALCEKCHKWRLFKSRQEFERIRMKTPNKTFECKNCEEPQVEYPKHWSTVAILGGSRPIIMIRDKQTVDNNDRNIEKEADTTKPIEAETVKGKKVRKHG